MPLLVVPLHEDIRGLVPLLVVPLHEDIRGVISSKFHCRITSLTRNGIVI